MRSKNTDTYENQNRSFRYTLLAVIGVLIVVGLLAYGLRTMNGNPADETAPDSVVDENQQYDTPGDSEDINVSQSVPSDQIPAVDSLDYHEHGNPDETGESATGMVAPVKGASVLKPFSNETPLYSVTLEQYVTHIGVDYEAPADSQVRAIDGGTVTKVVTDDQLGLTIEIDHGRGLVSKYSNLSTAEMVEEGDVVERGQVISGVGNSALFEILDPEHLHFELWVDGEAVDPEVYW